MKRLISVTSVRLAVAIASVLSASAAAAQEVETRTAAGLEEIVVTAQKRSENLQDVPISMLALGSDTLEQHGILSLSDINNASVPGLNLAPYPGSSDFFFPTFRGITTNTAFISSPIPIAVHVDGVYWSQLVGLSTPAADLERIEVLRGPQGVMAGRNATGGAINIHTARPKLGTFGFRQELGAAERGEYRARTVLNLPMGETFAAKLAYLWSTRDHQNVRNSAPNGPRFGERDVNSWRIDLRWQPGDGDVIVDYAYDQSKATGYDTPSQCFYPSTIITWAAFDPRVQAFIDGCTPKKLDALYYPFAIPKNRNVVDGHTLNVEWVVSDALMIRSITGYREVDTRNSYNYGAYAGAADVRSDSGPFLVPGTPFDGKSHPVTLTNEAFSQEIQFIGDVSPAFRYTAGLYYSSEDGDQHSGPNIGVYIPQGMQPNAPLDLVLIDRKGLNSSKIDSLAVFGQLSWRPDILDRKLEIVPGIRFTEDRREVDGYNTGWTTGYAVAPTGEGTADLVFSFPAAGPDVGFESAKAKKSFQKTTPALSLNYHVNGDVMTYAKYSMAFTSGGFDPISGPATAEGFVSGFKPETIESYEVGLKGQFFENRLRSNIAVFRSKFKDEQKSVAQPTGGWKTENVGSSTYDGVEIDLTGAITDNLTLTASYATLSHDFDEWIDATTGEDVTKLRRLIVPKNDYSLDLDYRFRDFGLPGTLMLNVNYTHRGETSTPLNLATPNVALYATTPDFSLLNARLTLADIPLGFGSRGRLTVAAWGKNLTDEEYVTLAYQGWVTLGSGSWGDERTVGVDAKFEF
jgi:iron complex outermembrane recepter protein